MSLRALTCTVLAPLLPLFVPVFGGAACEPSDASAAHELQQAHEVRARLVEPSGVAIAGPGRFWIVDDDRGVLLVDENQVSFSDRVDRLFDRPSSVMVRTVVPVLKDLEGAAVIGGVLYVVAEESGVLTSVTEAGAATPFGMLARPLVEGAELRPNRGFEGIAFLPAALAPDKRDHLVAVHEKHPKAVALFAWPTLVPEKVFVLDGALDAQLEDLSDVALDPKSGELLLLSAAGRKFVRAKLADLVNGPLVAGEVTDIPVRRDEKPEGITVDDNGGVWICTDGTGRLFRLAQATAVRR